MRAREILAQNVLKRREALGIKSQDRLAEAAGVSRNAIARLETDKTWPDENTVRGVAAALGCEESDLFIVPGNLSSPEEALEVLSEMVHDWRIKKAKNAAPERPELMAIVEMLSALDDAKLARVRPLISSLTDGGATNALKSLFPNLAKSNQSSRKGPKGS